MTISDTLDDRYARFDAFTQRVSRLDAPAWTRIEQRCANLNDSSFDALFARAGLTAKARELRIPDHAPWRGVLRTMKAGSDLLQYGIALAEELSAQVDAAPRPPMSPTTAMAPSSNDPHVKTLTEGLRRLMTALYPRMEHAPGVVVAVRAASEAVLRHDSLPPEAFAAAYRYVEPEIPFVSLEATR